MVNAPPCGACGWSLRWAQEHNGWACDRCRQFYPAAAAQPQPAPPAYAPPQPQLSAPQQQQSYAQPSAQQPQAYAPPQQQAYAQPQQQAYAQPSAQHPHAQYAPPGTPMPAVAPPAGGKKSSKGLVIGIAGVAVAGGVVAIVLLTRGGGISGGGSSAEDTIKGTVAALAAGDRDQLLKFNTPTAAFDAADCSKMIEKQKEKRKKHHDDDDDDKKKKHRDDDDFDMDALRKMALEEFDKHAEKAFKETKGLTLEVVDIAENTEKSGKWEKDVAKGEELGEGCTAKADIKFSSYTVKVKVADGDKKPSEQKLKLKVIDIGGHFFIEDLPKIKKGSGDAIGKLEEFTNHMCACKDKPCADKVTDEMTKWSMEMAKDSADMKPDADEMKKATEISKRLGDCMSKAMMASAEPPAPPPPPAEPAADSKPKKIEIVEAPAGMSGPCLDFGTQIAKLKNCGGFPEASRDAMEQSWAQIVKAWSDLPAASRNALDDSCKAGAKSIEASIKSVCH